MLTARMRNTIKISMSVACAAFLMLLVDAYRPPYNVPIVMDSLVGSIESDMGIKAT